MNCELIVVFGLRINRGLLGLEFELILNLCSGSTKLAGELRGRPAVFLMLILIGSGGLMLTCQCHVELIVNGSTI